MYTEQIKEIQDPEKYQVRKWTKCVESIKEIINAEKNMKEWFD